STSTCRSFATISSGVYLFFGIAVLLHVKRHTSGRTTFLGEDHVGLMQGAYWLRTAIISTLRLPPNVFLNHIVLLFSRLSFIFGGALFTAVIYLRLPDLEKSIPRFVVLVAVLFSMFCYSRELEWLATELTGRHRE
ncbi:MAG: hypothetical protein ACLPTZ_19255, partial [Beijerinckiaceae bacterium]